MDRVDFLFLKFKSPELEIESISNFIRFTEFPYNLQIFDNRNQQDLNMSKVWNNFVLNSNYELLGIIDSDVFVTHKGWLKNLVETFEQVSDLAAVGPITTNCGSKQAGYVKPLGFGFRECIISGFCFLFRKSVWETVGKFDERFSFYGQDSEWFIRAKKKGYKIGFRTDSFVKHIGNASIEQVFGHDIFLKEQKEGAVLFHKILEEKGLK